MKHEMLQMQLHAELKHFGLNPHEWSLKPLQTLGYLIQNKSDQNFALKGKWEFKRKRPTWKSLELASL